jgi:hypothetical protein
VKVVEGVLALAFFLLGVRSLVHWLRRPFDSRDVVDHVLFALFVTGRAGTWFALSGVFGLYAFTSTEGRAFVDDVRTYDWLLIVFLLLAAMQLLAGFFLGRRSPDDGPAAPGDPTG